MLCDHYQSILVNSLVRNRCTLLRHYIPLGLLVLLGACGGDTGNGDLPRATQLRAQEYAAPGITSDVATDGLNWINFRRQQAGLMPLQRVPMLDNAAVAHARYQLINQSVTHDEKSEREGYTGTDGPERLRAAGYPLNTASLADGEVIAATSIPDGFAAADGLITAIYHRYLIFEPRFTEAGSGAASRPGAYSWLTVNMVAPRQSGGLGKGELVVWPMPNQQNVRTNFYSNQETPDPVPLHDEVGYPVSVHADFTSVIHVQSFTLRDHERTDPPLAVQMLNSVNDRDTPASAASIVPLLPLKRGTRYDAEFVGTIDGQALTRQWSFRTR